MKYIVKSDFDLDVGKKDPIVIKAGGDEFVPATYNVPLSTIDSLEKAGTIERIKPEPKAPEAPPAVPKTDENSVIDDTKLEADQRVEKDAKRPDSHANTAKRK